MASGTTAVPLAYYSVEAEGCVHEKAPIIFIHGITTSKEFWNDIPRNIANVTKRKVYAVDLRNHGDSEWRDTDTFECNVDDVFHFMDSIQAQKAILVGHSLGGATAMRIALAANERVEKIVVEDMPIKNVPSFIHQMVLLHMKLNQAALQHLQPGLDEDAAKQFIADFVYDGIPPHIKAVISQPLPEHYNGKLKRTEDGRYTFKANVPTLQKALEKASKGLHPETTGVYDGPACFIYGVKSPFQVYTPVPLAHYCLDPDASAADKPPVIFMHGVTASKENWDNIPQAVANATRRKVYAIDARNHGDTEWNDIFNFDCNVDDILHFMDSIGAPKAILVGHSMGGITAIKTALRAPERVEKVVVEDMYVKRVPQEQLNWVLLYVALANSAIEEVPDGSDEETAKRFILDYFCSKIPQEMQKGEKPSLSDIQITQGPDGRFRYKANMPVLERAMENSETLMAENTGEYHEPASFIYGTLSPFLVGEETENIRKYFPNAEFVRIENATHNVHSDFPTEFTNSLVKFLLKS